MSVETYRAGKEAKFLVNALKKAYGETITHFRRLEYERFQSALHDLYQTADEMQRWLDKKIDNKPEDEDESA